MISSTLVSTALSDSLYSLAKCAAYDWSAWIVSQGGGITKAALIAQDGEPAVAPAGADPANNEALTDVNPIFLFLSNPINLILISAILFMFIVVRPQQKQQKEKQKALSELKKNDRVVTTAGIHGVVVQSNSGDNVVTIRIDENSGARMTVNRDTINIVNPDTKE